MEAPTEELRTFSSADEAPSSPDDSDDDVVTDYLSAAAGRAPSAGDGAADGAVEGRAAAGAAPLPIISVTPHSPLPPLHPPLHPPLPPPRPLALLEESLTQLQQLRRAVLQMRLADAQLITAHQGGGALAQGPLAPPPQTLGRLSASCPSLGPADDADGLDALDRMDALDGLDALDALDGLDGLEALEGLEGAAAADAADLVLLGARLHGGAGDGRRRSWAASLASLASLAPLARGPAPQVQPHGPPVAHVRGRARGERRRRSSLSLSSAESEPDDSLFLDSADGAAAQVGTGVTAPGSAHATAPAPHAASTHSLNEADLQRERERDRERRLAASGGGSCTRDGRDARDALRPPPPRLTLQKSVSTPSIVAARDAPPSPRASPAPSPAPSPSAGPAPAHKAAAGGGAAVAGATGAQQGTLHAQAALRPAPGTSSAAPSGAPLAANVPSATAPSAARPLRPLRPLRPSGTESETEEELLPAKAFHLPLDDLLATNVYDPRAEKRRKRGSIFFRKKKDKVKKDKSLHQWVAYVGPAHPCDWCTKPLPTQGAAVFCEVCSSVAHSSSCKDHILDCNKSKATKGTSKAFAVSSKFSVSKKSSSTSVASQGSTVSRRTAVASPWKRVATKLGVNQAVAISEERDADGHSHAFNPEAPNFSDDVSVVQLEFLDEGQITAADLDADPLLGLTDEEPDSWTPYVGREVSRRLKEKEVKRQEHMYEFILTEKHHCLTLLLMQKVFVAGLRRHLHMGADVERMFPRLQELTDIHVELLARLRRRQRQAPVVASLADILADAFAGANARRLKSAYGEFCSRHRDALRIYKSYLQDRRFAEFVRWCQANPLLKKKGIPECILFVTQRLTKYPLLIEPLIKAARESRDEQEQLSKALALVKEILVEVDAQVAEKEKEDRKLEIYNRIDVKSFTVHRDSKFKKADILLKNRKLRFEGMATLMQGRSKMQVVLVIVLSDVLFFLLENNNKYSFFTPDNKAGVVSLQKLLVREKAGQDSRGLYLISSNPAEPEMFELRIHKPKDKQAWIRAIRYAVQLCQEAEDEAEDGEEGMELSAEERQQLLDAKQAQIRQIVDALRQKDLAQAQLLEEKMALQQRLLAAAGGAEEQEGAEGSEGGGREGGAGDEAEGAGAVAEAERERERDPEAAADAAAARAAADALWREVLHAVQEVRTLASGAGPGGSLGLGLPLARSVSSVGERHSDAYVSPTLPRRAETFGGFDCPAAAQAAKGGFKKLQQEKAKDVSSAPGDLHAGKDDAERPPQVGVAMEPQWLQALFGPEGSAGSGGVESAMQQPLFPQLAAVQLTHHFYRLLLVVQQQMTTIHSLQAELCVARARLRREGGRGRGGRRGAEAEGEEEGGGRRAPPRRDHNAQLEELRNLQAELQAERTAWAAARDAEERALRERRQQLLRLQEQVREEQSDVTKQREQLFRRMEALTAQGLLMSPSLPAPSSVPAPAPAPSAGPSSGSSSGPSSAPSAPSAPAAGSGPSPPEQPAGAPQEAPLAVHEGGAVAEGEGEARRKGASPGAAVAAVALPLNLLSATNQQKVAALTHGIKVKQQLPFKLAAAASGGSGGGASPHSATASPSVGQGLSSSSSSSGVQQILPFKLSQGPPEGHGGTVLAHGRRSGGYQRLGSGSFSPPAAAGPQQGQGQGQPGQQGTAAAAVHHHHARTGSSPAMMQGGGSGGSSGPHGPSPQDSHHAHDSQGGAQRSKADRTHTYPKLPERFRLQQGPPPGGDPSHPPQALDHAQAKGAPEEEVIFF